MHILDGIMLTLGIVILAIVTCGLGAFVINRLGYLHDHDTRIDKDDLNTRIRRVLAVQRTAQIPLPALLLPTGLEGDPLAWLSQHFGISTLATINMRFVQNIPVPARIQRTGVCHYMIEVDHSLASQKIRLNATLAHECAHTWADILLNAMSEERTVDVITVMLGGGYLVLRAMEQDARLSLDGNAVGIQTQDFRIGYLSLLEFAYVTAAYQRFTNCDESFLTLCSPVTRRAYHRAQMMIHMDEFAEPAPSPYSSPAAGSESGEA